MSPMSPKEKTKPTEQAQGHPLFPAEEGEELPEVHWIHVQRSENGQWLPCPKRFGGTELTGEEQLAELFGGGKYQLIARNAQGSRITARVTMMLPGRPKPMTLEPEEPIVQTRSLAAISAGRMPEFLAALSPIVSGVIGMLQAASSERVAMIQAGATQQAATMQHMVSMMLASQSSQSQGLVPIMTGLIEASKGSQAGGIGSLVEAIKLGHSMSMRGEAAETGAGSVESDLLEQLAPAIESFAAGLGQGAMKAQQDSQERATEKVAASGQR